MSKTLEAVKASILLKRVRVSQHALQELEADELYLEEILDCASEGELIEDYPEDRRGASCLVRVKVGETVLVHTVWGYDPGSGLAVLITAYKPDPEKWDPSFTTRRR